MAWGGSLQPPPKGRRGTGGLLGQDTSELLEGLDRVFQNLRDQVGGLALGQAALGYRAPQLGVQGIDIDPRQFQAVLAQEFDEFGDAAALVDPLLHEHINMLAGILLMSEAVAKGELSKLKIEWDERPTACVVIASQGYPGSYPKGKVIEGLEKAAEYPDTFVFHAGTAQENGKIVSGGGRVLCVTGIGATVEKAIETAYQGVRAIKMDGAHYRKDIGWRALNR